MIIKMIVEKMGVFSYVLAMRGNILFIFQCCSSQLSGMMQTSESAILQHTDTR